MCFRAISNSIAPQPRYFFVLGLRPRTKKYLGFGTILLDIALKHTVYPLHIFSTSRYLDGKEKPKKTNDKAYNKTKRREKARESEKRSYKKEM